MINEHDLNTWRDEMITVAQAKEALDKLYEDAHNYGQHAEWYMLEEFIKQYEDWVKVKKIGAILKGKNE